MRYLKQYYTYLKLVMNRNMATEKGRNYFVSYYYSCIIQSKLLDKSVYLFIPSLIYLIVHDLNL